MKKWKCTVCGYIHEGDTPPEECPVCGADKSKFIEITEDAQAASEPEKPENTLAGAEKIKPTGTTGAGHKAQPFAELLDRYPHVTDQMAKLHAHPISVHIPNGVLPASILFLFPGILFDHTGFATAAFYNLVFVVLAMPVVFITGYVDWQTRFKGALTRIFKTKMVCAGIVFVLGFILMLWRWIDPAVTTAQSGYRWIFFILALVMLGAATVAGYLGGKLVFHKK
jgi:uncharacterized membrane protein